MNEGLVTGTTDPCTIIKRGVDEARQAMREAAVEVTHLRSRVHELEGALNRMVLAHNNLSNDTEGKYPPLDAGCLECTVGTVPDRLNTGLCPYHNAKRLLGHE